MFDLTEMEMIVAAGGLLLVWMLLSKGGVQTYKLIAFAGVIFTVIGFSLKDGLPW